MSRQPRPLELDFVVAAEIRPWTHPAPYDFHFSESNTAQSGTNTDLAAVVTMALAGDRALYGPRAAEVFDPVPRADYHDAILRDADDPLRPHTRNTILTLARVWAGLSSDRVHSKESAAAWALERLPREHRAVLERAVAIYRGAEQDRWDDVWPAVEGYAHYVSAEIRQAILPTPM